MLFNSRLRALAFAVAAVLVALFALFTPQRSHAQDNKPQLFINVTSEDPWKVSMAAFFGTQFALKQGHKATMFVTVQATPLFTRAKSTVRSEQFGKTVHEMLREFQSAGGKVLVCPVCMKALNLTELDLIENAEVATVRTVNEVLFRTDTQTLAW